MCWILDFILVDFWSLGFLMFVCCVIVVWICFYIYIYISLYNWVTWTLALRKAEVSMAVPPPQGSGQASFLVQTELSEVLLGGAGFSWSSLELSHLSARTCSQDFVPI